MYPGKLLLWALGLNLILLLDLSGAQDATTYSSATEIAESAPTTAAESDSTIGNATSPTEDPISTTESASDSEGAQQSTESAPESEGAQQSTEGAPISTESASESEGAQQSTESAQQSTEGAQISSESTPESEGAQQSTESAQQSTEGTPISTESAPESEGAQQTTESGPISTESAPESEGAQQTTESGPISTESAPESEGAQQTTEGAPISTEGAPESEGAQQSTESAPTTTEGTTVAAGDGGAADGGDLVPVGGADGATEAPASDVTEGNTEDGKVATTEAAGDMVPVGGDVVTDPPEVAATEATGGDAGDDVTAAQEESTGSAAPAGGAVVTEGSVTEGATGEAEQAVTAAGEAGGATEAAAGSTEGSQGAAQDTSAAAAGVAAVTQAAATTEAVEAARTTVAAGDVAVDVTTAAVEEEVKTTRPPPEATYKVTTIPVEPYLMINTGADGGYRGYIPDLLDKLAQNMNVEFNIQLNNEGQYGKEVNGEWTGMIGEVVRGEVDLAAAPLTVTLDREAVVDFTHPFMSFTAEIVIMKRSPYSAPRLESLEDLMNNDFQFAVNEGSSIHKLLQNSQDETHKKILKSIEDGGLMASNNEGVAKARWDKKFAFIMEGTLAEWIVTQKPCDLKVIPTEIYKRKYAFAIENRSELRDKFNHAIYKLQDGNVLKRLQDKWFRSGPCNGSDVISSSLFNMAVLTCLSIIMYLRV